ncbi:MAG: GNAT family protein [Anaerolineales bacterium]|nr:GNAT family protein [Anaerolineales bacterium]
MAANNQDVDFNLFQGKNVCLAPIDMEKDPAVISRWSHDSSYLRAFQLSAAKPLSASQARKQLEELEKESDKSGRVYHFTIREVADDRLVGTAQIWWIEWSSQAGMVHLAIGDPQDRGRGYGGEALRMLLRYAFNELNLFRLSFVVPDYNEGAQRFFRRAGFVEEARMREAVHRGGRYWDQVLYGLLRDEWLAQRPGSEGNDDRE